MVQDLSSLFSLSLSLCLSAKVNTKCHSRWGHVVCETVTHQLKHSLLPVSLKLENGCALSTGHQKHVFRQVSENTNPVQAQRNPRSMGQHHVASSRCRNCTRSNSSQRHALKRCGCAPPKFVWPHTYSSYRHHAKKGPASIPKIGLSSENRAKFHLDPTVIGSAVTSTT